MVGAPIGTAGLLSKPWVYRVCRVKGQGQGLIKSQTQGQTRGLYRDGVSHFVPMLKFLDFLDRRLERYNFKNP